MTLTFCLCEDREIEEYGLRLAICSIRRHCPDAKVVVYRPAAAADFVAWVGRFAEVTLIPHAPVGAESWNCKPHALLPLLRSGAQEVVWLDSDAFVARDCRPLFAGWGDQDLGICEEYQGAAHPGTEVRTRAWDLPVGRTFPRTLNTAVLRVTPAHIPLLERWQQLLADPRYVPWQTRPLSERPLHCWGDQDVLNALLGSAEFADVPVRLLQTGREVIHCLSLTSFPVLERLGCLFRRVPHFIHGQGGKPWVLLRPELRGNYTLRQRLIQELSPYRMLARRHDAEMGVDCPWLWTGSLAGRTFGLLGLGHYALRGLPLAAAAATGKWVASLA